MSRLTCAALRSSANCPLWLSLCFGCGIVAWDRLGRDIYIKLFITSAGVTKSFVPLCGPLTSSTYKFPQGMDLVIRNLMSSHLSHSAPTQWASIAAHAEMEQSMDKLLSLFPVSLVLNNYFMFLINYYISSETWFMSVTMQIAMKLHSKLFSLVVVSCSIGSAVPATTQTYLCWYVSDFLVNCKGSLHTKLLPESIIFQRHEW